LSLQKSVPQFPGFLPVSGPDFGEEKSNEAQGDILSDFFV